MKQAILTTGLNGLVGSKLATDFAEKYDFTNLDLRNPDNPIDITNLNQVFNAFETSASEVVIHFAAFTNVTAAWEQNEDKDGLCYQVNVTGTENIIEACKQTKKHLIHISTAYVFDGDKDEPYLETDRSNPIEWYGQTKLWAEELISDSTIDWTILRIDQPFRSDPFPKKDVAHRIIDGIKENNLYPQFTNHYFGPTFINDFVRVLDFFIRTKNKGLFHATSGEQWADYDFAKLINDTLKLGGEIKKGDLNEYLKTLKRPYQKNTALNCDKLKNILDFKLTDIKQAVKFLKNF